MYWTKWQKLKVDLLPRVCNFRATPRNIRHKSVLLCAGFAYPEVKPRPRNWSPSDRAARRARQRSTTRRLAAVSPWIYRCVALHLRADPDQLLLQARQRPVLDRLRCCERAQEIAEIVGERMKLNLLPPLPTPAKPLGQHDHIEPVPSERHARNDEPACADHEEPENLPEAVRAFLARDPRAGRTSGHLNSPAILEQTRPSCP
jgi:hypothetical protein